MDRTEQAELPVDTGLPRRRWCRACGRELRDPISRMRGVGAECDPDRRTANPDHDVDQDTIPGM